MRPPKVFVSYLRRSNVAVNLWSSERREKRNNWKDVLRIPYPRVDSIRRRLGRWGLESAFEMTSLYVNPDNELDGALQVHASYLGREEEILDQLTANATLFYRAPAISRSTGTRIVGSMLDADGKVTDPSAIDWYQTVMQATDVKAIAALSMEQVVADWRCNASSRTHPDDSAIACDPACDLSTLLTIDYEKQTAMLTDTSQTGPDNTKFTAPWYVLRECVRAEESRQTFEVNRYNHFKNAVKGELWDLLLTDFTSRQYGLRARMTFFFLNFYATPSSNVNDDLLMYKQYHTIFDGALGNWRSLSYQMFVDGALRKSLDQLEEVECGTAPIENFAREWFERFTVGLRAHNEGDVKILARGLMNCKDHAETWNEDLKTPGIIFSNTNETVWTLSEAEQKSLVDRILDFRMDAGEPPVAAQFLCSALYEEFAMHPELREGMMASIVGYSPDVVACARHLYDHNYDVTFALEHILQDKQHFKDTLGTKKRWPMAVVVGTLMDFEFYCPPHCHSFSLNYLPVTNRLKGLGMTPFEPPDVSGWDLQTVWTADRLTSAHDFMQTFVRRIVINEYEIDDFVSYEAFQQHFDRYRMGPTSTKYSVSVRLCGDLFVHEVGKKGNETVDASIFFDFAGTGDTTYSSKWKRRGAWQSAAEIAILNVCQFVC